MRRGRAGVGRGAPRPPPWRGHGHCWTPGAPLWGSVTTPAPNGSTSECSPGAPARRPCSEPHGGLGRTRHRLQLAMVTPQAKSPGLGGPRRRGGGLWGARRAAPSGGNGGQARRLMMCVTSTQSQQKKGKGNRALLRASSLTAPYGQAPPTPPRLCNQSRSAGSPAQAGSHSCPYTGRAPQEDTQAAALGKASVRSARLEEAALVCSLAAPGSSPPSANLLSFPAADGCGGWDPGPGAQCPTSARRLGSCPPGRRESLRSGRRQRHRAPTVCLAPFAAAHGACPKWANCGLALCSRVRLTGQPASGTLPVAATERTKQGLLPAPRVSAWTRDA
ncbi:unnamed protein product [Rangifer tarandus platyrhynchus]|uniref:Uncharacterized protein n=1 Tax=Rangifer tarandus platyrhynchus TaxID=3082113 RepID=A0ABN8YED8_RANTA|nr:unnamed protein product [Rangifer tarandus platyrhynchus]